LEPKAAQPKLKHEQKPEVTAKVKAEERKEVAMSEEKAMPEARAERARIEALSKPVTAGPKFCEVYDSVRLCCFLLASTRRAIGRTANHGTSEIGNSGVMIQAA